MPTVNADQLKGLAHRVCAAAGSAEDEAALVAEHLVEANLKGHDSHGVGMIPRYCRAMNEGLLQLNRHAEIVRDAGAVLTVEGGLGFGQVIAGDPAGDPAELAVLETAGMSAVLLMPLVFDGTTIAFVEVKARHGDTFGDPVEAVNWKKQRELGRSARVWIARHGRSEEAYRFDVVGVLVDGERVRVRHVENAFSLRSSG